MIPVAGETDRTQQAADADPACKSSVRRSSGGNADINSRSGRLSLPGKQADALTKADCSSIAGKAAPNFA